MTVCQNGFKKGRSYADPTLEYKLLDDQKIKISVDIELGHPLLQGQKIIY